MSKSWLFGGACRVTLATGSATWDVDFQGPGVIEEDHGKFMVCTEFGTAMYDKRCVVGYITGIVPEKEDEDEQNSGENAPDCVE